jgi:hypothetical protein
MKWTILPLWLAALFFLWIILRGRYYKKILSDPHLLEFAQLLAKVRLAALEKHSESARLAHQQNDPRAVVTSRGLAMVYTIRRKGEDFTHCLSVGLRGRYTPRAVGGTFIALASLLLKQDLHKFHLSLGTRHLHICTFTLDEMEHANFRQREVSVPELEHISALHAECRGLRDQLPYPKS